MPTLNAFLPQISSPVPPLLTYNKQMLAASFAKAPVVSVKRSARSPMTVAASPATGHHTISDALRDEALSHFFTGKSLPLVCTPTTGGVNNCVSVVPPSYVCSLFFLSSQSLRIF